MDINEILDMLGLDLSNPDVKNGAIDAINAILSSRIPPADFGGGTDLGGGSMEIELDPDLIQPSAKHAQDKSDADIEIEDEENILDKIQHNDSEDDYYDDNVSGTEDDSDAGSQKDSEENSNSDDQTVSDTNDSTDENSDDSENTSDNGDIDNSESTDTEDSDNDDSTGGGRGGDSDDDSNEQDIDDANSGDASGENDSSENGESEDEYDEYEDDDLLDDTLKGLYDDKEKVAKQEARRIKRERTILAAKRALDSAIERKVNASLIRELEKSIEALENLSEAKTKSLNDMSDEEFDLMINRVLDAIDAVGNSELSIKTAQEKELQAKEIKKDLDSKATQNELSAEDAAKIRQETQAVKAREKEKDKYKPRAASSFKGFNDFLNSLYRAIALQVKVNEVQDDSWSALSRRNSGVGVLKQGKKLNELPDAKIPIIDFYFDCSASWGSDDIKIGKKAVQALVDMEEKGQIKINLYYFGNYVSTDPNGTGSGTSGWNEIVKNVIATQATNVVIMTDDDMEDWWVGPSALSYTVPGYVWYLWKNGRNAPRLPRDLKGRGGTQQFSFSMNDL